MSLSPSQPSTLSRDGSVSVKSNSIFDSPLAHTLRFKSAKNQDCNTPSVRRLQRIFSAKWSSPASFSKRRWKRKPEKKAATTSPFLSSSFLSSESPVPSSAGSSFTFSSSLSSIGIAIPTFMQNNPVHKDRVADKVDDDNKDDDDEISHISVAAVQSLRDIPMHSDRTKDLTKDVVNVSVGEYNAVDDVTNDSDEEVVVIGQNDNIDNDDVNDDKINVAVGDYDDDADDRNGNNENSDEKIHASSTLRSLLELSKSAQEALDESEDALRILFEATEKVSDAVLSRKRSIEKEFQRILDPYFMHKGITSDGLALNDTF